MTAAIIIVVALSVIVGLVYNRRYWRPAQEDGRVGSDGLQMKEVTGPLASLAVLLLAFVLVQSFSSWSAARKAEATEATAVLLMFREAELFKSPRARDELRRASICYATSVIEQEWPAMERERISNVPTFWSTEIRRAAVRSVRLGTDSDAGKALLAREAQRATGRQDRLAEARAAVPDAMFALMLLAVVVALLLVGIVTAKGVTPGVHVVVVVAAALVFASTLLLIRDIEQPYGGVTGRDASQTTFIRTQMLQDVSGDLPCDDQGLPKDAPLFRPQTIPLS